MLKKESILVNNKNTIKELLDNFELQDYKKLIDDNVYKMIITNNMIKPNSNGILTTNQTLVSFPSVRISV